MRRNSCIVVLSATLQCVVAAVPIPFTCQSLGSKALCVADDSGLCFFDGVCQRTPTEAGLRPLDKNCGTFTITEGEKQCKNVLATEKLASEFLCASKCAGDFKCTTWSFAADLQCRLCSDSASTPTPGNVGLFGESKCKDCHDMKDITKCHKLGCEVTDGTCKRKCPIVAEGSDGSCSNFCVHEEKMCKTESRFNAETDFEEDCKKLCDTDPNCNAFDFDAKTKKCFKCTTKEIQARDDAGEGDKYAGVRTCTPLVTTQSPVTTQSSTKSFVTTQSPVSGSTMKPSGSMTGDVGASSAIAKAMLLKTQIKADEITEVSGEDRSGSAIFFVGGLLAGVSATLVVFVVVRRHFGKSVGYSHPIE